MGASLRKKAELARMAGLLHLASALIEPAFVVVGHKWYFYLVYLYPYSAAHVLEHGSCSTNSVSGVFKILRVLRNTIEYGLEGFKEGGPEAEVGYWGGFLKPVLERLAGGEEKTRGNASATTLGDEAIWMRVPPRRMLPFEDGLGRRRTAFVAPLFSVYGHVMGSGLRRGRRLNRASWFL
jgi:hypothetical protein